MSDARRARAERRAALASHVAQTAPVGGRPRRSPSPAVNAATGPAGDEQQASSQQPSMRQDGHTGTPSLTPAGSLSRALRAPMEAQAALIAANELLRYCPVTDVYEEWLDRVAELVCSAAPHPALRGRRSSGGAPAASSPRRRPGSKACGPWAEPAPSGASATRAELPRNPSPARSCSGAPCSSTSRPCSCSRT